MGARCQVCDGPIVNGRCKLCGMPYRNDEVLYHLNESRSEHYKHATGSARKEMRQNQVPLPDRKAAGSASAKRTTGAKTASVKKKSKKKGSALPKIIAVVVLAGTLLSNGADYIKSKYEVDIAAELRERFINEGRIEDMDDATLLAILDMQNNGLKIGTVENGYYMHPGEYVLESSEGKSLVIVERADTGEIEEYKFNREGKQKMVELHDGDGVALVRADSEANYILLYFVEQYDV